MEKLKDYLIKIMAVINPCEAPDDSLRWRTACTLFPDCFCCAGMRGVIYGILLTVFAMWVF